MQAYDWYSKLIKPTWAPPAYLFWPVWTFLYIIIAISFWEVFIMYYQKQIPFIVLFPFILNLVFNFAFTPIQFWLKNNLLASIDISLILITLIWSIISIYRYSSWISYAQVPYLLWVWFATYLQFTITYLNR